VDAIYASVIAGLFSGALLYLGAKLNRNNKQQDWEARAGDLERKVESLYGARLADRDKRITELERQVGARDRIIRKLTGSPEPDTTNQQGSSNGGNHDD
jgi:hypothetical protein